ncbi:MAG: hypothetical protein ABI432_08700 [Flavobacteriales bacterium]
MRTERTGLLARQEQNWAWLAENASDPTFVAVMRETHTLASRIDVIDHRISNIEQYQPEMGMDMPTYSIITTPQGK